MGVLHCFANVAACRTHHVNGFFTPTNTSHQQIRASLSQQRFGLRDIGARSEDNGIGSNESDREVVVGEPIEDAGVLAGNIVERHDISVRTKP
jgi:hypothetical protein